MNFRKVVERRIRLHERGVDRDVHAVVSVNAGSRTEPAVEKSAPKSEEKETE